MAARGDEVFRLCLEATVPPTLGWGPRVDAARAISACRDDDAHPHLPLPALDEPAAAWAFTADLSHALGLRAKVRVADVDADGRAANSYPSQAPVDGPVPAVPWALHLAVRGGYRLLGFDLDARHGPVDADLAELRDLLRSAGITGHVVCASGPGGGRHIWVALTRPATGDIVAAIARALARRLPSLDVAPLTNPRTGALRPPGAPHRRGGHSRVLDGNPRDLLTPTAGPAHLTSLLAALGSTPPRGTTTNRAITRDEYGHLALPGARRPLPPTAAAALHHGIPAGADTSTSAVLFTALCGAARSHWRLADLTALLNTAPGLEHARSGHNGPLRPLRSRTEAARVLTRQWTRAVTQVATTAPTAGEDPTFRTRTADVVNAVTAIQARADAAPGRWARGGGPADRRVLDAACDQALAAVRTDIELDIRRLSHLCGIGRETARRALHRLANDGWLHPHTPAVGSRAASWRLPAAIPASSTGSVSTSGSQAVPRPARSPGTDRTAWRHALARRLADIAHDVFTPRPGLGHHASRVYAALTFDTHNYTDLVDALGYSPALLDIYLERLHRHGLAQPGPGPTWRRGTADRTTVADHLGVTGLLNRRERRHATEREAWAWWLDELAWMRLPRDAKRRRSDPAPGQTVLPLAMLTARHRLGAHPRRPNGTADYRAARAIVLEQQHQQQGRSSARSRAVA